MEEGFAPGLSSSPEERRPALLSKTQDRVLGLINLEPGHHDGRGDGLCLMELVAWLAGEEHDANPSCTSPALRPVDIQPKRMTSQHAT